MNRVKLLFHYLYYKINSKQNSHIIKNLTFIKRLKISSYCKVRNDDNIVKIEAFRKELKKQKNLITVNDLGQGSSIFKSQKRKIKSIVNYSCISKRKGRLLYEFTRYFKPEKIIELGTCIGISTLYLSMAAPKSQVITIEGCKNLYEYSKNIFKKFNITNIKSINLPFDDIISSLLKETSNKYLLFIDGNHNSRAIKKYVQKAILTNITGSAIIIDDIRWSEDMYKAWRELKKQKNIFYSVDLFHSGILFF